MYVWSISKKLARFTNKSWVGENWRLDLAAAAALLQSCPTLCDPIDGSPPGSTVPGILQARTLEWVAISFSSAWKWSHSVVSDSVRPHGRQPAWLPRPWDSPGKDTGVGCRCLLHACARGLRLLTANSYSTLPPLASPLATVSLLSMSESVSVSWVGSSGRV